MQDQNTNLQMEITSLKSENVSLKCKIDEQQKVISRMSTTSMTVASDSMHHDSDTMCATHQLNRTATNLEDEKALEIIELTLLKYQNFLDFLRNAGFGKLIELAECNQQRQEQKQHSQQHQSQLKSCKTATNNNNTTTNNNTNNNSSSISMKSSTSICYDDKNNMSNQEDYELAYLAAKLLMRTDRARVDNNDDESVLSRDIKSLINDFKFDLSSNSLYMNETSIGGVSGGGVDSSMPNFDADGKIFCLYANLIYIFKTIPKKKTQFFCFCFY